MKDQAHKLRELFKSKSNSQEDENNSESSKAQEINQTKIYTITSGKGGVGKTNFTVNLALALQSKGEKVAVIDADLGMANIDVVLGLTPQYNLSHVINGKKEVTEIVLNGPKGLDIIPGASGVEEFANLTEYKLKNIIKSWEALEDRYDIILIDTGAGISNTVINFTLAADEIIVISTTEPTSVTDAYGIIKVIASYEENSKVNLVINQAESDKEGDRVSRRIIQVVKEFLEIELEILGLIPKDESVGKAVKRQQAFLLEFPNSKASRAIKKIRDYLLDIEDADNNGGVKTFFKKLIGLANK
jgi:flagellar biosynthesis protein FlhG